MSLLMQISIFPWNFYHNEQILNKNYQRIIVLPENEVPRVEPKAEGENAQFDRLFLSIFTTSVELHNN